MIQILYEHTENWSVDGGLRLNIPALEGRIRVSPDSARRRANGYLARYVALAIEAGQPMLVWQQPPLWRMPIYLSLPGFGQVTQLGYLDVDALTRQVIPLSNDPIKAIQNQADDIATRLTSTTA